MSPSDSSPGATPAPLGQLLQAFSQTRHDINNVLAVLLAMAELSQRNPETAGRLTAVVLERGPVILQKLHEFQELLSNLPQNPPPR